MNATSHTDSACPEFVLSMLDWLEDCDERPATIDQTLSLLSNQRRRLLVQVLQTHEESLTLPDAAEEVARKETGKTIPNIDPEHVTDVYLTLYHDHLPRLIEAGLIEYDQQRDLVSPAPTI